MKVTIMAESSGEHVEVELTPQDISAIAADFGLDPVEGELTDKMIVEWFGEEIEDSIAGVQQRVQES